MMKKSSSYLGVFTLILFIVGFPFFTHSNSSENTNGGSVESWGTKYYKAGCIKICDPKMGTFGSVDPDKALMHINLVDVAKVSGHLCGGTTSGFVMTKLALESLYGTAEIPVRGDIRLTSNKRGEPMEIAAYIIGASDEKHHGSETWKIDDSIKAKKGALVLIFERISTGKKVKLVWDKMKTMNEHTRNFNRFVNIKLKSIHGLAIEAEAKEFAEVVNSLVMKIVNGEIKYEMEVLHEGERKPTPRKGCLCHAVLK